MANSSNPLRNGGRHGAQHPGTTFAALDLGTNNCRMLVATPAGATFRVIDSFSRIVRLGEGLGATGTLAPAAMERAAEALRACCARLARRPGTTIRAVATEACRKAANGAAFLHQVRQQTGLAIDIIPAREEAELAVESCATLLDPSCRRALLFDIGGGSTELAWVRLDGANLPQLIGYDSLPLGVVSLSERHGNAGFEPGQYEAMAAESTARLQAFERIHCIAHEMRQGGVQLIGTSGTVTTLAGVAMDLVRYRRPLVDGTTLSAAAADAALRKLRALGRTGLQANACVGVDRADHVLPGCAIFDAIRTLWPAPLVTVADRGLREGILLRLMRQARGARARPAPRQLEALPA